MDDVDKAQHQEDMMLNHYLNNARRQATSALATGECLYCEEPLPPGLRWCGAECRDDWQQDNE